MIKKIFFAIITLGLLFSACQKEEIEQSKACSVNFEDNSQLHPKAAIFQEVIDNYAKKGLPGISLLIRDGDGQWAGAAGMADIEKNIPMQVCHISKVASVTKLFVGVSVMQLVEDGVFELDDPIHQWLSEEVLSKVENADKVSIRQLMNHTTGIYDLIDDESFYLAILNNPAKKWTPEELIQYTYGDAALFEPGTDVEYSNTNFLLMAMVIESATGTPHHKLIRERIINPLNLNDTYYHWHESLPDFVAQGYYDLYNNGTIIKMTNFNTGSGNGYGGIYSTTYDMKVFIEALLRDRTLLSETALAEMLDIRTESFGTEEAYGVSIRKDFLERGGDQYGLGHRGRDLAYTADLFYFPEYDITLSYLINYGTDAESELRDVFFDYRTAIVDALIDE